MSNRVNLVRQVVKDDKTGEQRKEISMFDNDASGTIEFDNFPDSDIDLLAEIIEKQIEGTDYNEVVNSLLDYLIEFQKGLFIAGTWYDWEEIESVMDKYYTSPEE